MLKKFFFIFFCFFILTSCSINRSDTTTVSLNINEVVVFDDLKSACSSGKSIGKNIVEIIPDLGESFVYYKDETICLKVKIRKEHLITNSGISKSIIDIYEIPETNYFLRISK